MKTILTSFNACLLITFNLLFITAADAQEIEWQNTIGGSQGDRLGSICQTNDGGYILAGYSNSGISGDKTENNVGSSDFWIVKTDLHGNILWQNSIGGNTNDLASMIQQTADGGYIIGGISNSNISGDKTEDAVGGFDYWVVKTDSSGNIQWQSTIGGSNDDRLLCIKQTSDGGYILGGNSNSNISGDKTANNWDLTTNTADYWIVKTDALGNIQWDKTIGGNYIEEFSRIEQTSDGGYILGGGSSSGISGNKTENTNGSYDYWILKVNASGNIQWQNSIGGNGLDWLYSIQQTSDGGYILGGASTSDISGDKTENTIGVSGQYDYWLVKTDSAGNLQWQNTIGGNQSDGLREVIMTSDAGYISGGVTQSGISGDKVEGINSTLKTDLWIIQMDSLGNIKWQNAIGGDEIDAFSSIQQTSDEGFILGGYSKSDISGDKTEDCIGDYDYWIMKLSNRYNLMTGKLFLDINSSFTQDVGEPSITSKAITEQSTGRFAFSQENGFFSIAVFDTGNFILTTAPLSYYSIAPVAHGATFTGINQTDSLNDFAFQPLGIFNDLCLTVTSLNNLRQGGNASYLINYENLGTTTLNGTVKIFPDNVLNYHSSSLTPVSINTDSIEWNVGTLAPFQSGSFVVTFTVAMSAPIGSIVNSIVQVEPIINDANTSCNIDTSSVAITGSFDPNDILVSEDTLLTAQLPTGPWLDYTIRFQNTGNDTAFTVKIINPIDTNKLELNSIEFVNSSHPVELKWLNYNRNMEFLFSNILLPDSNVNEPMSHGFVHYRIKPKTTLLAGDSITNKAYIYFDFNAPVETNTAVTKIVLTTGLTPNPSPKERGALQCYPNPAKDEITIHLNNPITNNSITKLTISIYDVFGKLIRTETTSNPKSEIRNLKSFPKGVYFVEVTSEKEIYRGKFVKE